MSDDFSGVAALGLIAAGVFGFAAYTDFQNKPPPADPVEAAESARLASETAEAAAADAQVDTVVRRRPSSFTKAEFSNFVYGMTKAEVRAKFGSPVLVRDRDASWFYTDIPVFDEDAGIQVPVTIRFMGIDSPTDEVAAVMY
ncbi:MAG: hypothetical protein EON87_06090 [Brevundimonas sp.]|nr:MAG: hypothetical protein EON87_06090 [Brevundimonas sp.]